MPLTGPTPKPGDLIEFKGIRYPYDHWGVYIGDGDIVHLQAIKSENTPLGKLGITNVHTAFKNRAKVVLGKLEEVADGRTYQVNNTYYEDITPYSAEEIVKNTRLQVGKEFDYDFLDDNCEHFANLMRHGKKFSKQTDNVCECLTEASPERAEWSLFGILFAPIMFAICFLKKRNIL